MTLMIVAHKNRDIMGSKVPNDFVQVDLPKEEGGERVCMKIVGELVDYLVEIALETYAKYVVKEKNKKIIYVVILKAIHGMLQASLLWYHKLSKKLKDIVFIFNPYNSCVCNQVVKGKQHKLRFNVDNILLSHEDAKLNDEFHQWLNKAF